MAEQTKEPKGKSKAAETTMGLLGSVLGLAGNLVLGPDSIGLDIGAPFKMGAAMMREKREQSNLLELLRSSPATAPIAEYAPAIIDAGGIANNSDLLEHPEVQGALSSLGMGGSSSSSAPVGNSVLPGESGGMMTQPQMSPPPATPAAVPQMRTAQNFSSPEFLARAAALRPDLAEKILVSQATASTDPTSALLKNILLGKQIENYESPEDKARARADERRMQLEYTDKLIRGRTEDARAEQKSYLSQADKDKADALDGLYSGLSTLPDEIPALTQLSAAAIQLPGGIGKAIVSKSNPEISMLDKQLKDLIKTKAFADGGKNLTGLEKELTFGTAPDLLEAPEFYPQIKKNYLSRIQLLRLSQGLSLASNGQTKIYETIPQETIESYKIWKEAVQKGGRKAIADPTVQALMQELGIDGLATTFPTKK
jgi:hypothetical protein